MAKLSREGNVARTANAKRSSGKAQGVTVPFQPSTGGARVIKSKGASSAPKERSFKLSIKTKKS